MSNKVVDQFYNEYNNNADFNTWLNNIMPETQACEDQEQQNPWHKYNVLGHILHSVEAINQLDIDMPEKDRKMLSFTMFLHDIGKPECHIRRMKDGKMIDSFFNHNLASEKIANRVLNKFGFDNDDSAIISTLVRDHDIFMFIKKNQTNNPHWRQLDDSVVDEEVAKLDMVGDGEKLMRELVMVGRADSMAQNEKMTRESFELLDKFDTMLDSRANEHNME